MLIINRVIRVSIVIRVSKKYYPQTLLEECKYVIRKNKMENLLNDNLNLGSSHERIMRVIMIVNLMTKAKTLF